VVSRREPSSSCSCCGTLTGEALAVGPELSPDDGRLAFDRMTSGGRDIWLMDVARGGLTRLTTDAAVDGYPVWSPDGSRIAFESGRKGTLDLWVKASDGSGAEELLLEGQNSEWPMQWSKDGRYLLFQQSDLKAKWNLWALPMTGSDRTPIAVATTPFAERMGQISPDSRWVAYDIDEAGRPEITVQAFPRPSQRWAVSTGGGTAPRWSSDGREIYFVEPGGRMMAAPVRVKHSMLDVGAPVPLFATGMRLQTQLFKFAYAVARDGRFLISAPAEVAALPIQVIVNAQPQR
jgi:Tol biopolymer transport system component